MQTQSDQQGERTSMKEQPSNRPARVASRAHPRQLSTQGSGNAAQPWDANQNDPGYASAGKKPLHTGSHFALPPCRDARDRKQPFGQGAYQQGLRGGPQHGKKHGGGWSHAQSQRHRHRDIAFGDRQKSQAEDAGRSPKGRKHTRKVIGGSNRLGSAAPPDFAESTECGLPPVIVEGALIGTPDLFTMILLASKLRRHPLPATQDPPPNSGRADWIRTSDLLNPIQAHYQAVLQPVLPEPRHQNVQRCLTLFPPSPKIRGELPEGQAPARCFLPKLPTMPRGSYCFDRWLAICAITTVPSALTKVGCAVYTDIASCKIPGSVA